MRGSMSKLDKAMEALELFPNITGDIRQFLLKPIIEAHEAEQERNQLMVWLDMARQTYMHRLTLTASRDSALFTSVKLAELEAYIDRL
jgi:hypothetical protein